MDQLVTVTSQSYAPLFRQFLSEELGIAYDLENTRFIASVLHSGEGVFEIVGCTALNAWTNSACEAHAASDGSQRQKIDRHYIWTVFDYAFRHAGKNCMLTYVATDNFKSIALQELLGFTRVGLVPGYYGDGKDAHLFAITRQQWLEGKWGSAEAPSKEDN